MIAYLKGTLVIKNPSMVVMDVGGVGYEINISLNTYSQVQHLKEALLYTHLLIREDAHLLYGFAEMKEKDIFLALLSVSGIGAGTARIILSYMKPDEIAAAILQGDSGALEKIKGIGKKTAERAVLELKDKLSRHSAGISLPVEKGSYLKNDALNALNALGINKNQAEQAVNRILLLDPELPLEDLIKKVLKGL